LTLSFEGISLGILFFRWNGLLIALGVIAGALFSIYEAKRRREDLELIYHLLTPMIIWGVIGARLWYIFAPPLSSVQLGLTTQYYLSHPLDLLALWIGGYGIPGLWIGGCIALIVVSHQNDIPFLDLADLLAPGFALAQAIGRLGNYFNQELYGLPTTLPWKMFIAPEYRLAGFESAKYYHPLFAYESILSFISFALLFWLARRYLKSGHLFFVYLIFYSSARFLLEFLRVDVALVNGTNVNQVFFAIIFICAGFGLYWIQRPEDF
jgi:phosphatidylglycerol:prolipoprotein diacylglycerol transferase